MALTYSPGVRIIIGYRVDVENPPETYSSKPTEALQAAVRRMGKKWKPLAPRFIVAPGPGSSQVVIGVAVAKAPRSLDRAFQIGPNSAIAKTHYVTSACFQGLGVDDYSDDTAGILPAVKAAAADDAFAGMQMRSAPSGEPECWLLSDDGRKGSVVYGEALWKPGASYESDEVRTWAHEYDDGEGVRLIGIAYATVDAEHTIAELGQPGYDPARDEHQQRAKEAVAAVRAPAAPPRCSWYIVSDTGGSAVEPAAAVEEAAVPKKAPPLASTFSVRGFDECAEAFASLDDSSPIEEQQLDGVERVVSFDDLSVFPDPAPHHALLLQKSTLLPSALEEPNRLVSLVDAALLGVWNAKGTGRTTHGEGWGLVDLSFEREDPDEMESPVEVLLAVFEVCEGWAIWVGPGHRPEHLASVMGFSPFQSNAWKPCEVWIGE